MSCWGGCIGWEGLARKALNQVQRENDCWWEAFEKVIGYDRLFAIQYQGAWGTVEIVWALTFWIDKDSYDREGQEHRVTVSERNKYGRNEKINDWNDHNDKSVDPGSATIFIIPVLPGQEVRRIAFMAWQRARHPYLHGSGSGGGGLSCYFLPKGVAHRISQSSFTAQQRAGIPISIYFCSLSLHYEIPFVSRGGWPQQGKQFNFC